MAMRDIGRRDFLKYASAASAVARMSATTGDRPRELDGQTRTADVRIATAEYVPAPHYPIQPQRHSSVRMTDHFWKPRIARNAEVTIPFEVQKLGETERGFSLNVLEAAILSLATHPNRRLQDDVGGHLRRLNESPRTGNSTFELAATLFTTTGNRQWLDRAIETA